MVSFSRIFLDLCASGAFAPARACTRQSVSTRPCPRGCACTDRPRTRARTHGEGSPGGRPAAVSRTKGARASRRAASDASAANRAQRPPSWGLRSNRPVPNKDLLGTGSKRGCAWRWAPRAGPAGTTTGSPSRCEQRVEQSEGRGFRAGRRERQHKLSQESEAEDTFEAQSPQSTARDGPGVQKKALNRLLLCNILALAHTSLSLAGRARENVANGRGLRARGKPESGPISIFRTPTA